MIRCSFVLFPESFVHCSSTERETQPHKVKWINGIGECSCSSAKVTRGVKCCRLWPVWHWVLWLLQSCCLQCTQRSATTWGYSTISVGFGRMLSAKFLQQFAAHNFCRSRPQCGIEWNQPIHKFILEKKSSILLKFFINLNSLILNLKNVFIFVYLFYFFL